MGKCFFAALCVLFCASASAQSPALRYEGEAAFAYGVGVGDASSVINTNRIVFETVHGVRINPYLFAGAGVGFNYFYGLFNDYDVEGVDDTAGVLPVFADFKGYYPASDKLALFLAWDFGAAVGVSGCAEGTEFYTSIGPGVSFGRTDWSSRGSFSIRFQHMGTGTNAMLFRVGWTF